MAVTKMGERLSGVSFKPHNKVSGNEATNYIKVNDRAL